MGAGLVWSSPGNFLHMYPAMARPQLASFQAPVKSRLGVNIMKKGCTRKKLRGHTADHTLCTSMSVHLDAVLLPVGVVGFACIPVGVGDGRVVLPPAPSMRKSFIFWQFNIKKKNHSHSSQRSTHLNSPSTFPAFHSPIQADETFPVPTWRSRTMW